MIVTCAQCGMIFERKHLRRAERYFCPGTNCKNLYYSSQFRQDNPRYMSDYHHAHYQPKIQGRKRGTAKEKYLLVDGPRDLVEHGCLLSAKEIEFSPYLIYCVVEQHGKRYEIIENGKLREVTG